MARSHEQPYCLKCGSESIGFEYDSSLRGHHIDEIDALRNAARLLTSHVAALADPENGDNVTSLAWAADVLSDVCAMWYAREHFADDLNDAPPADESRS